MTDEMQEWATIYREDRDLYIVIPEDNEAYLFNYGTFHQILTRYAEKGCKIRDIEKLMDSSEHAA